MPVFPVLGMHRSGTSLVAQMLHECFGVDMGERFRAADRWNRGGYYEDLDFRNLDQLFLNMAGGDWAHPPDRARLTEVLEREYLRALNLIRVREHKRRWGWKSPRSVLTMPVYWAQLPVDVRVIEVHRNADDVVRSLMRREAQKERNDDLGTDYWYDLVQHYEDTLAFFIAEYVENKHRPVLWVTYDRLIDPQHGRKVVEDIAEFVHWNDPEAIGDAWRMVDHG